MKTHLLRQVHEAHWDHEHGEKEDKELVRCEALGLDRDVVLWVVVAVGHGAPGIVTSVSGGGVFFRGPASHGRTTATRRR